MSFNHGRIPKPTNKKMSLLLLLIFPDYSSLPLTPSSGQTPIKSATHYITYIYIDISGVKYSLKNLNWTVKMILFCFWPPVSWLTFHLRESVGGKYSFSIHSVSAGWSIWCLTGELSGLKDLYIIPWSFLLQWTSINLK